MRRQIVLPLALLFIALGVPSNAQNADVIVDEGAPLTVECALRVEERAQWLLDGAALPSDLRPAGESAAAGRLTARLHAPAARAQHAGVYTCARPPAQRVRVHVVRSAAVAPAASVPGEAESAAPAPASSAGDAPMSLVYYDVGRFFSFNCSVPRVGDAAYVWRKNGTAVEELWDLHDRYTLDEGGAVFRMKVRTNEDDFGNYSCAVGGAAPAQTWELRGRPHAKIAANTNVVEGQKLKLLCKVVGKPYPSVAWSVSNSSDDNATDVTAALGGRAALLRSEQGVERAELQLEAAQRADAGVYTCSPLGGTPASTVLRVKDMYAALWPFLGICAEVFVLCAIILVYEKRRTKPELDDSDTDNHEQKKS